MVKKIYSHLFYVINKKAIILLSRNSFLGIFLCKLIQIISNNKYILVQIDNTENLPKRTTVKDEFLGYVFETSEIDRIGHIIPKQQAKLGYNVINNGIVASMSSFVLYENKIYKQKYYTSHKKSSFSYRTNLIIESSERFIYLEMINNTVVIEKGIFFGGYWNYNWYHWVIEILPRVELYEFLPQMYKDYPIIIPEEIKNLKTLYGILKKVLPNNDIIFINKNFWYKCKSLVWLDSPVISIPNLKKIQYTLVEVDTNIDFELMSRYRNRFVKNFTPDKGIFKRVFLARKQTRRPYNQDEIMSMLSNYGFEEVYLEEYSFEKQIEIFYSAECIVGKTGAAWTNLLFSNINTKALIFAPSSTKRANTFANLAQLSSMNLYYYFYSTPDMTWSELSNYKEVIDLDVIEIEQIIKKMLK